MGSCCGRKVKQAATPKIAPLKVQPRKKVNATPTPVAVELSAVPVDNKDSILWGVKTQ